MSIIYPMATTPRKPLLETSALIVGYAMSRLDRGYLEAHKLKSWKEAFRQAGDALKIAPASLKNLRDEFDPVHGNARKGWQDRPMRLNRQRIMGQLCEVSDAALLDLVNGILTHHPETVQEVVEPLSNPADRFHNVAERLRTGRLAEEFFLANSTMIASIKFKSILDHRNLARGYDFGVRMREDLAIEVKGLKQTRGSILFTDREWSEARSRHVNYWLVVVGNIESKPVAKLIVDPANTLKVECKYQTTIVASWRSKVSVA